MTEKQLGLSLPRERVKLGPEAPEQAEVGTADIEAAIGYTDWVTKTPPPMAGWWDITDHKTGTDNIRWWFDGECWLTPHSRATCDHSDFAEVYAWRGLKAQHPHNVWQTQRTRVLLLG